MKAISFIECSDDTKRIQNTKPTNTISFGFFPQFMTEFLLISSWYLTKPLTFAQQLSLTEAPWHDQQQKASVKILMTYQQWGFINYSMIFINSILVLALDVSLITDTNMMSVYNKYYKNLLQGFPPWAFDFTLVTL